MGKRGPAPKPTALKLISGTYRADRAARKEAKPKSVAPSCPGWLSQEAKREWRRVVGDLEALGLVTQIDRAALAAYCDAYQMWYDARRSLDAAGTLVQETESGYLTQRPEIGIINTALKAMRQFMAEFGMTPAARTRVNAETPDVPQDDPWAEYKAG